MAYAADSKQLWILGNDGTDPKPIDLEGVAGSTSFSLISMICSARDAFVHLESEDTFESEDESDTSESDFWLARQ